jgi:hypothetical protein
MTREQIESVLKSAQGKQEKDGAYTLPEGASLSLHVAHDGASMAVQKVEGVRFDGELLWARSAKQTTTIATMDVFAVTLEGGGSTPARRPAGFV